MSPQGHHLHLRRHRRNARRLGLAFWLNAASSVIWLCMLPVTLLTGLKGSVPYVAAISVWALFVGHMASALAAAAGRASNEAAVAVHEDKEQG